MTIEDKLKLAKEALDSGSYDKETIEYIFPELAESEDERIRKKLLQVYKDAAELHGDDREWCYGITYKSVIAWLEKQGNKPVWTDNDKTMVSTLMRDVDQIAYINEEGKNKRLEWLKFLEDKFNKEK